MASGVGRSLGISEERCAELIAARWDGWVALVPALACVPDPQSLEAWLREVPRPESDEVLRGLAELASESGRDDRDAALVLAWMLHAGADALVVRVFDLGTDTYHHVAAFLWIAIRTFDWRAKSRVAANILLWVRQQVLLEFDEPGQLDNHNRVRAATAPVPPQSLQEIDASLTDLLDTTSRDCLDEVLAWGCEHQVIDDRDRRLLLALVEAVDAHPVVQRASTALLSRGGTELVGQWWGISGRTVRRSARGAIDALAAALGQVA
ncbi:MAG: hypothetical protein LCH76_12105 [Actinobacteria bacterium]|nr:hypothetical protein [Actinomycetota bacterium]